MGLRSTMEKVKMEAIAKTTIEAISKSHPDLDFSGVRFQYDEHSKYLYWSGGSDEVMKLLPELKLPR